MCWRDVSRGPITYPYTGRWAGGDSNSDQLTPESVDGGFHQQVTTQKPQREPENS